MSRPMKMPRAAKKATAALSGRTSPRAARGSFIALDGEVGYDITAASVREQLNVAGGGDIEIRINSIGGSVTEGMAIYTAIRRAEGKKTGIVEGIAASMASVILQACDERVVAAGSYVMIHNPSSMVAGESEDLRKTADLLDKMGDDLLDIYESRSGLSREKIKALMDAETYMTAEEAVELGFADRVAEDVSARISLKAVARLNAEKMPESLRALAKGKSTTEEEMKAKIKALEEENAKLKAEKEEEGEEPEHNAEDDDSEEEKKEDAKAEDDDEDCEDAKAVLAAARRITGKRSFAEVEGALMALGAKATASVAGKRKAIVAKMISEGRLQPSHRKWAESASEKAFSAFVSVMKDSVVVPVGKNYTEKKPTVTGNGSGDELNETEKAFAKATGMSKKDIIAARGLNPAESVQKEN